MFRYQNYIIKLFIIFFISGIFLVLPTVNTSAANTRYTVLVINSYHSGFIWTDEENKGIIETLTNSKLPIDTHVEYLDWKNFPESKNIDLLYSLFKHRYATKKIDMIIASDDKALEFSLKYRNELFSSAPVVFCGVNLPSYKKLTLGFTNVAGPIEELDPLNTIKEALKINPSLKNIYLVYENTESGLSIANQTISSIHQISRKLKISPLNNKTYHEIINLSKTMEKNSAILITSSYFMDVSGAIMSYSEFCEELSKASAVPIYHLYDYAIGHGVLGGSMISGYLQGSNAGHIALKVLKGYDINKIPITNINSVKSYYDYEQLKKFDINPKLLPVGSTIINKPFSFIDTYRTLVVWTLSIIIILFIFLLINTYYLHKIRKMKHQLEIDNDELSALYEEIAATDETLREQYTNLEKSQEELKQSEERYRLVVNATSDVIWDHDLIHGKMYFSDNWYAMLGLTKSYFDKYVIDWETLIHPEDKQMQAELYDFHIKNKTNYYECDFRIRTHDDSYKWVHSRGKAIYDNNGIPYRMTGSHTDISELKEIQQMLTHSAYHDSLTGLSNRMSMNEKIGDRIESIKGSPILDAMLFIDIDNFKYVNDTMGHTFGDKLLKNVSNRLLSFTNDNLLLFRLGGDEFILYTLNQPDKNSIKNLAKELMKLIKEPFNIDGNLVSITISVGIAIYPEDAANINELLRFADMAMYMAKKNNKNIYYFFNNSMNAEVTDRVNIENQLRNALQKNEFTLYYQPIVKPIDKVIEGFEALIRWNNEELGMVFPDKFISIAEETGFIIELGEWILRTACTFIKDLNANKNSNYIINVNISVIQLLQKNFTNMVLDILNTTGLKPSALEIEITESTIMESTDLIIDKLRLLRNHGIGIAIDDFGTGHSSLARLRTLPITTLKIDKSFIDNIAVENSFNEITDTIIELGHKLNLKIVAEGVETTSQLTYLNKNNCDTVQGYLFFKPIPGEELYKIL